MESNKGICLARMSSTHIEVQGTRVTALALRLRWKKLSMTFICKSAFRPNLKFRNSSEHLHIVKCCHPIATLYESFFFKYLFE